MWCMHIYPVAISSAGSIKLISHRKFESLHDYKQNIINCIAVYSIKLLKNLFRMGILLCKIWNIMHLYDMKKCYEMCYINNLLHGEDCEYISPEDGYNF